jgi:hypothetical protein
MTPARQLIPIIAVIIFYAVYFFDSTLFIRTGYFKILAIFSFFISWLLTVIPSLRYGASKDKIYDFLSQHLPRIFFWILPPFRDNITAGIVESLFYLVVIMASYWYLMRKNNKMLEKT